MSTFFVLLGAALLGVYTGSTGASVWQSMALSLGVIIIIIGMIDKSLN